MRKPTILRGGRRFLSSRLLPLLALIGVGAGLLWTFWDSVAPTELRRGAATRSRRALASSTYGRRQVVARQQVDTSGFTQVLKLLVPWDGSESLEEIAGAWRTGVNRALEQADLDLQSDRLNAKQRIRAMVLKAALLNSEGKAREAYDALSEAMTFVDGSDEAPTDARSTILFFQGVTALRRGENENCIMCRGESSCIFPISRDAVHVNPEGSEIAIRHFTDYLEQFPHDLEVKWLLNLAHMTLGEYPERVDSRFRLPLDRFARSEFDIGRFRDVGHVVGINRFNQAGGAILEDFNNDGLLDFVVTTMDPTQPMMVYCNGGDGTFADSSKTAAVAGQLGGLNCVQTDYNNDGRMDIYIPRGAWLPYPIRPTLLRNDGDLHFTDVTEEAGLLHPGNSVAAVWADYDNDGFLDLYTCDEHQPNRLYHNLRNGTFEEVAADAGVDGPFRSSKGAAWLDFDNDDYPDLFVNNLNEASRLFRNNHDGTFEDVTTSMGIIGPQQGFSCWAWDYDNDGWLDIFATSYDRTLRDIVRGILGQPHTRDSNRLYHNRGGKQFDDVTAEAGLDLVLATMGSNYGDFDNDGFLDFYLGTGDPSIATLVPNRMFKNVGGARFAEITGTSRTGHLQKGHGVACGDWDRDGDVDVFIEMGGAINGDKFHNVLFQNPGQGNNWLCVKLVGTKSNRPAIGARIKAVVAGNRPREVHRHVSSGSSFGANPLEQMIGLGKADRVQTLEIHWPASGTTQVFHDLPANQAIEVKEFDAEFRVVTHKPVPLPDDSSRKTSASARN